MKRRIRVFITLIITIFLFACAQKPLSRDDLARLQESLLPSFTPPEVLEKVLPSGARIFLLEDHELPIVNFSVIIKGGSIYEPEDRLGLSELTAMLLRDGGTVDLSPDDVDRILEDNAIELEFGAEKEMLEGSVKALSSEFNLGLQTFFDLLFRPRFDEKRLEVNRLKFKEYLKRQNDDPEYVAARDFRQLVYGDKSPWARVPNPSELDRITVEDIRSFWANYVHPNNILISVAGDFEKEKLIEKLNSIFEKVANRAVTFPPVDAVKKEFKEEKKYVKKDISQAFIYMGHLGIKRHNPDKFPLQIMNTVLGGGSFKSRLMEDIRSQRGLAYSVWSHFGWGTDYGLFQIYCATQAANLEEVIDLIEKEVSTLALTGRVSDSEFHFAKDFVLNQLIFEFDNSYKIARSRAQYYFWGYPTNYWEIYRDGIKAVKIEDVKRVANKYLQPGDLKVLVVGP